MALCLLLRTKIKPKAFTNPSLFHFYSTFNSNDDEPDASADDQPSSMSKSPFSSYFADVKKSLKRQQLTSPPATSFKSPTSSFSPSDSLPPRPDRVSSLEEIRRNLSEFRRRSSTPPPWDPSVTPSSSSPQISLQELYKRNMMGKSGESMGNADTVPVTAGRRLPMDEIRESLRQMSFSGSAQDKKGAGPLSLSASEYSLKLKPSSSTGSGISSTLIGGTNTLPASIFGKEMKNKKEGNGTAATESKTEFLRMYSYQDLGEKLRTLRPAAKERNWFSLEELNERLIKLREMEKEKAQSTALGLPMLEMRQVLKVLAFDEEKANKISLQRLDTFGQLGRTPTFMQYPPKEHLVEKYFHPDNLSSAEKLKIELAKVRDEFKMSESDCGSARVQVAQLTTKIKHLSSVLHKKDKHSRKGLQAMVQRRKRLLKYLRRTDWNSYCFVISKLGLRDNPDLKH